MLYNPNIKCPIGCWSNSVHFWSWLYQGSAVGVLPRVSLCYLNTMLLCFSEQDPEPNKFWGRRLFRDTHTVPSADGMLCFMGWKSEEESTRRGKHEIRVSLTLRSTSTRQTAKRRSRQKGGGEKTRGKERRKVEIRLLQDAVAEQQLSKTLHRSVR